MIIYQESLRRSAKNYTGSMGSFKSFEFKDSFDSNQNLQKIAFFCHSHIDKELVKGLITDFNKTGIELYVDWNDNTMPAEPNEITAKKLQKKIKDADVFFYLVTENSMKSTWCPWEIGFADAINKDIFIIPTTNDGETIYGNEYLKLYKIIEKNGAEEYQITFLDDYGSKILNDSNLWMSKNG